MPYTRLYNYPTPYDKPRTGILITNGEVPLTILCAVKFSRFRYKDALNTFINMSAASSRNKYSKSYGVVALTGDKFRKIRVLCPGQATDESEISHKFRNFGALMKILQIWTGYRKSGRRPKTTYTM